MTRRWPDLVGFAANGVREALITRRSRQRWFTVVGIGLPIALLLTVTSVSTGLAAGATIQNPGIDYWIVPESSGTSSPVVAVGGPQFGEVHSTSARLTARTDVAYASPVLQSLVRVQATAGRSEFVLAIGVIPRADNGRYAGLSTAHLAPGDPHYAGGSYDGPWTGEAVLSRGAATLLDVEAGQTVTVGSSRGAEPHNFTVANVSSGGTTGVGELPVMVVHLGELQAVTGADSGDRADQLLVSTSDPGVRDALAAVYPRSRVLTRSGLATQQVLDSALPRALALGALTVAVVVGVLFAASTMGMAVAAEGRNRAVLAAVGLSSRSRAILVATDAVLLSLIGGVLGVLLGYVGAVVINLVAEATATTLPVTVFRPVFVAYGLVVAVTIGLLTVPYLLVIGRRTTSIGDLAA